MGNSPYPFCVEERVSLVIRGSQREDRSPNHGRQQLGFLQKSPIRVTWSLKSTDGKGTVSAQPQEQRSGYWLRGILSSNSFFLEYNYRLVTSLCCPLCCCFNPEMMMWDFCESAFLITFRLRCAHHDFVLASENWRTFSLRRKHRKQKHIWMKGYVNSIQTIFNVYIVTPNKIKSLVCKLLAKNSPAGRNQKGYLISSS